MKYWKTIIGILLLPIVVYTAETVLKTNTVLLRETGGANTVSLTPSAMSVNRTLTLPDATDTLVGRATTDTLTNKSISGLTNTLTNITANTNADLTGPITSAGNATAVASQTGTGSVFVMQASPALTSPAFSTISNTGTLTLPTSTDTLIGRATSDVLTNKSISGSTNTITNVPLATAVTGTLPIANGGTGQTTKSPAFDALSPMTTSGDIIFGGASGTGTRLANGTSGQVLQSGGGASAPSWVTAASGGKNYITNNEATTDTSGWATYADAAAASPVDGTGGTPSSTFARNTTTPLRGSGDFLWTHSAANRQGEGFSYDFTIDAADKAKVLQGSFEYKIASGTFADNDLVVWIYDVTNATLIQPAPYLIKNHLLAAERFPFEFQTSSSSVSYRLIVHVATATATAYTMQLDNFTVGPNAKLYGSPIIDVVSKTMTLTNAGNATVTARMSKVGDIAWFQGTIAMGSSLPTGSITLNMPTGMTIDTAKSAGLTVGIAGASNSGGTGSYTGQVRVETSTAVIFYGDSNAGVWNATVPRTFAQNDRIDFTFPVAIVGWSSSVIMSNDASTSVVAASYYLSANTAANNAILKFDTANSTDTHGAYSTGSGQYTVPVPGKYFVQATVVPVSGTLATFVIRLNTNTKARVYPAANGNSITIVAVLDCVAGDLIDFYNTVTTTFSGNAVRDSSFTINRLSGPSQIGASESVNMRASNTAGTSITSSLANVPFATVAYDTHAAFASPTYTVTVSGKYRVNANLTLASVTNTTTQFLNIQLQKNGTAFEDRFFYGNGATILAAGAVSGVIDCIAGDTLRVQASNTNTIGLNTTAGRNTLSIVRVGN